VSTVPRARSYILSRAMSAGSAHVPSQFARAVTRAVYGAGNSRALPGMLATVLCFGSSPMPRVKGSSRRRNNASILMLPCRTGSRSMRSCSCSPGQCRRGHVSLPADHDGSLPSLIRRPRMFLADLPNIHRRRERRAHAEVLHASTSPTTRNSDVSP
jgi:hypothetical protein